MLCEAESNCLADAASPACYQRYFTAQTESAHSVAPLRGAKKMKWPLQRFMVREYYVSIGNMAISLFETPFCQVKRMLPA
jgi:hypothetical protein